MRKVNLSISGCMGRMGQQLIKSLKKNKNFKLVSLTENKLINKKIAGLKPSKNSIDAFKKSNVIIDFTVPECTLEILKIASKLKKRVVIGTTGFSKKEENLIKKFSKKIPILKAGNMSLGVNLLMYLTEIASKSLGNNFLSKVYEVHHKHKIDYPSGTALLSSREDPHDNLLKEMGTGLLVTSLIGSTINANTGDYSRGASGFWVEDGQICYPVSEITIAGNLRDMLKGIILGNDARKYFSYVVPSILVESMTLAGS